ncbi:alpha-ketoacid dehydrogenase subunit beta [Solimonas soli]|jgi:pyruvate dehydrogenase E1 component beta subunit|uniref:alpha-ketoacid dehydrogenase subunit beta n=1 Tax=Solimonas soli TaxID=413479 RepID=UPI0004B83D51|nr:alpha-ketoacid dehydrogenase subunit beta [Solimonas soli]
MTIQTSKADKATIVQALNWALDDAMAADDQVIVFGEEVADPEGGGLMKVTQGLSTKYGSRVRSTPISEMAFTGAAVGAAITGMRPVIEIMLMNFLAVCMDPITNHAAKLRFMSGGQTSVPMVIRTMTGSGFQTGGQHSDFLEAWFCHTPGIKVVMPSNAADAYGLMLGAIRDPDPVLFVEHLLSYWTPGEPPERGKAIALGKARIARPGRDVTLIGYSRSMMDLPVVAQKLAGDGIDCEIVDLRTVSPLDMDTILGSVRKTGRVVIVHEAVKSFGVGAEVASRIYESLFRELKAPIARVASKDAPVPFAKHLEAAFLYSHAEIEAAVRGTLL